MLTAKKLKKGDKFQATYIDYNKNESNSATKYIKYKNAYSTTSGISLYK